MEYLFLDESGEFCFNASSIFKHGLIATLLLKERGEEKALKNVVKRIYKKALLAGWNPQLEFKGFNVYNNKKFGAAFIEDILHAMIQKVPSLSIHYIVVNKAGLTHQSFRSSSYGIAYNFFAGKLLLKLILEKNHKNLHLIFDRKNKETHSNKRFQEYLESTIQGAALEKNEEVEYRAEPGDSDVSYGLRAVDFFCWSLFRWFEQNDNRFLQIFQPKIETELKWYVYK